jgi:hypothetical protein
MRDEGRDNDRKTPDPTTVDRTTQRSSQASRPGAKGASNRKGAEISNALSEQPQDEVGPTLDCIQALPYHVRFAAQLLALTPEGKNSRITSYPLRLVQC